MHVASLAPAHACLPARPPACFSYTPVCLCPPCAFPTCLPLSHLFAGFAPPVCLPAVVKRGSIVEQGRHEELMRLNRAYAALVQAQQAQSSSVSDSDDDVEGDELADQLEAGGMHTLPIVEVSTC